MKCLVIQTSPERISAEPVTNEDGTPHVYATMAEARAELRANGYSYNRANQRYYIKGTEYRAYIVREDSEEYADAITATTTEEPEQTTAEIIAEQARDYYRDTIYSAITAEDIQKADDYTNEHLKLTVEVMDALGIFHASGRMLVAIAQAMRWTLDDLEQQATEQAHEDAARSLIAAYAEAIGDAVTDDDPEAIAAHQVAREAIGYATATDDDRATVAAMVEAIAERTHAAEAIEDAREAWTGPDYYRIAYSDGGMDATNDGTIWYETAADLARDLRSAYESATDTHLPYAERIERPAYQRAELEAFLGDFLEEYDADAIEAEATEYDPATGRTVWTPEAVRDLWTICERHELYSYAPAV